MNLFILCIAMILANNWALACPGDCCGPQNCGSQNCGSQNCGSQNCGSQDCGSQDCETDANLLDDDLRTSVEFMRYDITSCNVLCEAPPAFLGVKFPTDMVNLGNRISPVRTILQPYYQFETANLKLNYTIVVIDIDVPSPVTPVQRSFLVGLRINVNGETLREYCLTSGTDVAPYIGPGPAPGTGPHRVLVLAYEQSCYIDPCERNIAQTSAIRMNFDLECFQSNYTLNLVAGNFWTSCVPDDYCNVCDRNKPYRLNQGLYSLLNNDNLYLSNGQIN